MAQMEGMFKLFSVPVPRLLRTSRSRKWIQLWECGSRTKGLFGAGSAESW